MGNPHLGELDVPDRIIGGPFGSAPANERRQAVEPSVRTDGTNYRPGGSRPGSAVTRSRSRLDSFSSGELSAPPAASSTWPCCGPYGDLSGRSSRWRTSLAWSVSAGRPPMRRRGVATSRCGELVDASSYRCQRLGAGSASISTQTRLRTYQRAKPLAKSAFGDVVIGRPPSERIRPQAHPCAKER